VVLPKVAGNCFVKNVNVIIKEGSRIENLVKVVDNFYFLFLDEIYTPNLNEFLKFSEREIFERPNHLHFGISGVIIPASGLSDLNFKSRRIKNKYYPKQKSLIFHYIDILNNRDCFSDLKLNQKKKKAFTESLSSFVKGSDFKYSCVFVDKHELVKKYGVFDKTGRLVKVKRIGSNLFPKSQIIDYNLYLLCLKKILEYFFTFITNRNLEARGIVVAEARGEREDAELREAFHKIHCYGISKIVSTELRKIILDLFIVPKSQNYIGTQLADLVLYSTYDSAVSAHNIRNDHFISYEKILKKKLVNKTINIIP